MIYHVVAGTVISFASFFDKQRLQTIQTIERSYKTRNSLCYYFEVTTLMFFYGLLKVIVWCDRLN